MMLMKKITFNALLNHKAHNYKPMQIEVEKVIPLYGKRFEQMRDSIRKWAAGRFQLTGSEIVSNKETPCRIVRTCTGVCVLFGCRIIFR